MVQPIDYTIDIQNPFVAGIQGLQYGDMMRQVQEGFSQREAQAQRQQIFQQDMQQLSQMGGAKQYSDMMLKYPELKDQLSQSYSMLSDAQKQSKLNFGAQVLSALNSENPTIAIDLLNKQADAEENAGQNENAAATRSLVELGKLNPNTLKTIVGINLASDENGRKLLESVTALEKAPVEIANIQSQINERVGKLNLDKAKLQSEVQIKVAELQAKGGQLEPDARKLINEATVSAVASEQSANRLLNLATRMENEGGGKGALTKFSESLANLTGQQDEFTLMRQEYIRLRNTLAVKNLPPGPATDKDIELALQGFPNENSDTAILASFMRGMAKLQQYEATTKDAEAEWVNATGTLGKARKDIEIGGIQVPKGTSYVEFQRKFGEKRAEQLAQQQDQANVETRSYMRFAKPTQ